MLPKTTPEQRARFYEDVEHLIAPGFLTHPVSIAGVRLQLRTLSPGDLFMLKARASGASNHEWRTWTVATSLWMIDGRALLGHDAAIPFLYTFLMRQPRRVVDVLFSMVLGLFSRAQRSVRTVETYCFEQVSRYRWLAHGKDQALQSPGVPGAQGLGRNLVQQIWLAFNMAEDQRQRDSQQWEGFKLVASSNAPKAIKKIDKADTQRREEEDERRQKELDLFYYRALGVVGKNGEVAEVNGAMHRINGSKSVEDLEDEMRRWVTGDADQHDAIVNAYKERIKKQHMERQQRQEDYRRQLQEKRDQMGWEEGDFRPQPLVALTAEQLQQTLRERQGGHRPGVAFIHQAPQHDRVFRKYVQPAASGGLQVSSDGRVVDPQAQDSTDRRTLNQLIKSRNPAFGEG